MKRKAEEGLKMVVVPAGALHIDHSWNSRIGWEGAENDADRDLQESIRQHGVLQAIRVRRIRDDGGNARWAVVVGFRRATAAQAVSPDLLVPCLIQDDSDLPPEVAEAEARVANLVENLAREDLALWQVSATLYDMRKRHPEMKLGELARRVGLSRPHCSNLISIRRRAGEQLWAVFVAERVPWRVIAEAAKAPKREQLQRLQELLGERTKGKRGKATRPSPKDLQMCLASVDERFSGVYAQGVAFGLLVALGRQSWPKRNPKAVKNTSKNTSKRTSSRTKKPATKRARS